MPSLPRGHLLICLPPSLVFRNSLHWLPFVIARSEIQPYYLVLSPASALADSLPRANAYFLPAKRISASVRLPSSFFLTTAESPSAERLRSINRAGMVATTFLP